MSDAKATPSADTSSKSDEPGLFRVKADTSAKALSGALAAHARAGATRMRVQAIGAEAVNQAIKAIIIGRANVYSNGIDFVIRPLVVSDVGRDAIALAVEQTARHATATPEDANVLRVNGSSQCGALAGAIAGKARDGARVLSATGIGPAAVLKIVKALALAREYTKDSAMDIYAAPHFVELKIGEETRTGVCFDVHVKPVSASS